MCDNYLHWQAHVYQLEAKGLVKKLRLPKFILGEHVKIADDEHSSDDYGVWFGKSGRISQVVPRSKRASQDYRILMDDGGKYPIVMYVHECDLERIER